MTPTFATDDPVWYVAYASNLSADRLTCYLAGGRPEGGRRTYEGCRDPSPPTGDEAFRLPGRLVFAGRSRVWGGAMAFYDTEADGEVVARGYRLTFGQLSDLVSQEARHPVGANLTPAEVAGRPWPTPSGIYEALVHLGDRDGAPQSLPHLATGPGARRRRPRRTCAPSCVASASCSGGRRTSGRPTCSAPPAWRPPGPTRT